MSGRKYFFSKQMGKSWCPEIYVFIIFKFFFIISTTPHIDFSDSKGTTNLTFHLMNLILIPDVVNNEIK